MFFLSHWRNGEKICHWFWQTTPCQVVITFLSPERHPEPAAGPGLHLSPRRDVLYDHVTSVQTKGESALCGGLQAALADP